MTSQGVPAASHWGRPVPRPRSEQSGASGRPAPSGLPHRPQQCKGMKKGGDRCGARPVKGTHYCIGHTRSMAKG
jgi:hypothetical protein